MNYIVVFLYRCFKKNKDLTYKFFYYLTKSELINWFTKDFKGLIKLIFLSDKLIQICNGRIWNKFKGSDVSTIHFGVPCLITAFTTFLKSNNFDSFGIVCQIWDLFLAEGYLSIIKAMLYLLELQQSHILRVDTENLFLGIKDLEKEPLSIMRYLKIKEATIKETYGFVTKKHIKEFEIDKVVFKKLSEHYEQIHKPILKFWSDE